MIEIMVMITIVAVLATIIGISLGAARLRTRDTKRISQSQEVAQALEDYYFDEHSYPAAITAGNPLIGPTSGKTYLASIPSNPSPRNDGDCPDQDYSYDAESDGSTYFFSFCLGHDVNDFSAGTNNATPFGFKGGSIAIACVPSCGDCGDDGCGGSCGSCGGQSPTEICSSGSCITDTQTVLMLHMNGTDNAQVFTDSSSGVKNVTPAGNAKTENTQTKFGVTSGYFDGSGDYLTLPYSTDIDIVNEIFTIDGWIYNTAASNTAGRRMLSTGGGGVAWNATNGIHILLQIGSNNSSFQFQYWNGTTVEALSMSIGATENEWHHFSASYDGTEMYVSFDGVISSATRTMARPSTNPTLAVATIPGENGNSTYNWTGYIDELRISKGIARWTENFTPPTAEY